MSSRIGLFEAGVVGTGIVLFVLAVDEEEEEKVDSDIAEFGVFGGLLPPLEVNIFSRNGNYFL